VASRGEARTDTAAGDVLGPAWSLRWRAPELALLFAERAGAVAKLAGDGPDRLRAEATVVVSSCRLGQRLGVVERAIDAVRLAERQSDGMTAAMLRVELAGCARTAGVPLVGAAVLRPVLTLDAVQPSVRADALVQMVGCLAQLAEPSALDDALAEADRLYAEDRDLDPDNRVLFRALLRSVASGEQRRRGDARAAVHAAQEGAALLTSLNLPSTDNGEVGARIALRLVHGLLDLGRMDEATAVAAAELAAPVRAPAANAIGWLALAMAVRKHLVAGAPRSALALLRDAADLAERHRLSALRAEALTTLSDAHERVGQLAEALDCLRTAQGVRLRRARSAYAARTKLVSAFGETTSPEEFVRLLGDSGGRRSAGRQGGPDREQAAALLGRFGLRHLIPSAVTGTDGGAAAGLGAAARSASNSDVTMVLVDLVTPGTAPAAGMIGEQVVSQVLDRVRAAAPTEARVARVGGAELAVLLPSTQAGQTERWVEQLRGAIAKVDWGSFTPGLAVQVRVAVAQQSGRRAAPESSAAPASATPSAPPASSSSAPTGVPAAVAGMTAGAVAAAVTGPKPSGPATGPDGSSDSAADVVPKSMFELPTVPLLPLGIGFQPPQPAAPEGEEQRDRPASRSHASGPTSGSHAEDTKPRIPKPSLFDPSAPELPVERSSGRLPIVPAPTAQGAAAWPSHGPGTEGLSAQDPGAHGRSAQDFGARDPGARDRSAQEHGAHGPSAQGLSAHGPSAQEHGAQGHGAPGQGVQGQGVQGRGAQARDPHIPPILPALPILPPLEPAPPDSMSALFQQSAPSHHGSPEDVPLSSDSSVRITAAEIAAAATEPEPPQPREDDPYRSPFADSPFADPIGDPNEPSRPRHAVDADAGRSVLSSLGITAGSAPSGGGRRRAREDTPAQPERAPEDDRPAPPPTAPPPTAPAAEWMATVEPAVEDRAPTGDLRASGSLVPRTVTFDDFGHLEPLPPTGPSEPVSAESRTEPMARLRHDPPTATEPLPETAQQTDPGQQAEPKQDDSPPRTGRRRRSVQLADLLTEALMAYQTVQDTNDARTNPLAADPSSSLPGPTSLPTPLAGPVGLDPAVGDEQGYPGPARHRGDPQPGESRWLTTRWDPTEERS
jgi:hypothetical protein